MLATSYSLNDPFRNLCSDFQRFFIILIYPQKHFMLFGVEMDQFLNKPVYLVIAQLIDTWLCL